MSETDMEFHSVEEVEAAIAGLSSLDIVKIRNFAKARLVFSPLELTEDELISESLSRSLEGVRRWNRKLDIVQHLIGVMKSLATDQRRKKSAQAELLAEDISEENKVLQQNSSTRPNYMSLLETEETIGLILQLFINDINANIVFEGLWLGETKLETLARTKIKDKEYVAARKRITRKVLKMNDGGLNNG